MNIVLVGLGITYSAHVQEYKNLLNDPDKIEKKALSITGVTRFQKFIRKTQSCNPRASVAGYPTDNTTVPNDSLVKVNGSGQKTGPSIILKVMSGDVVDIAAKSFWKENGSPPTTPSVTDVLNSLANGIIGLTNGSKGTLAQLNTTSSPLYTALNNFITNNNPAVANKPKAYINWILLDEKFNYVNTYPQSGAIPVRILPPNLGHGYKGYW